MRALPHTGGCWTTLIDRFRQALGKSAHGGQTLYEHSLACARIAHRALADRAFVPDWFPSGKRDQILFATFVHDIGKLDPTFAGMLEAARRREPLPSKRVKHEASTLEFEPLVTQAEDELKDHLGHALECRFTSPVDLDDVLAFAVTHHGLFYLSLGERGGQPLRRIRREWTVFSRGEVARITLADLLFDYHPVGGLVIISDLLSSFCHEEQIADAEEFISKARSMTGLIGALLREGIVEAAERSSQEYDPRKSCLRDLLRLLAGGLL